jgi:Transposase and inactivated derivatives
LRFEFLKNHRKEYNIEKACKTLKISRSGFYEYLNRKPSLRDLENEVLSEKIKGIFEEHHSRYGSTRITQTLNIRGIRVNRKRVSRLMRLMNLVAKGTRKHYKNYNQKKDSPDLPNLLNQTFITISINKVWVGDITYIPTKEGTLYLSVYIDLYSRKVVGWSMGKRMKEAIVIDAFLQAYGKERPSKGLIIHTD